MNLPSLPGRLTLQAGRPRDYLDLHAFHYLPKVPRTYAQVWTIRYHPEETSSVTRASRPCLRCVVEKDDGSADQSPFTGETPVSRVDPPDPPRLVAVAVLSWPYVRCAMRERHFKLHGQSLRQKLAFANAHLRTISRVVVHPQFRSLGLAVHLVKWICNNCSTRYVEASARMAEFHPLFERGGMTRILSADPTLPAYFLFDRLPPSPLAGEGRGEG